MKSGILTLDEARAKLPPEDQQGRRYAEPWARGTMRTGFYAPRGHDPQKPHDQDELYVVVSGTGTFVHDGTRSPFKPGDALFVAAGVAHRFEDFSDDFGAWVVFWGPKGGESE